MNILFFGRYDPAYSRNRVLLKGLRSQGISVSECRVDPSARWWALRLLWRYLRRRQSFDAMIVAFPGQEAILLARLLTRRPIVFDAFTSHYEGYVLDRQKIRPGSFRARWYRWLDRTACHLADAVLTDTDAHTDYFVHESGLDRSMFHRIFVGTDTDMFVPAGPAPEGQFRVHFHGTNIPLQGVSSILKAQELLRDHGVVFSLIGIDRPRVPYHQLGREMSRAHVCLGIFGDTVKTHRVIPNKVFEALAVGRPVITADTLAIRELLDDGSAILIPTADPRALAGAILKLKSDPALRLRIGQAGQATLLHRATPGILGRQVVQIIERLSLCP
jgi:glycosyltransferase involved in cell wall biosynthesis